MKKQFTAFIIGLAAFSYIGLSGYVIAKQGAEELLLCADKGGLHIPFSKELCRNYLFAFRGSQQDIDALHQGIGASFVIQGESPAPEREKVLKFLIGKGLDVNRIDMHQLTALHSAVIADAAEEVDMLLRNGASINVTDKRFGLTPLELALKLKNEGRLPMDGQAVIPLLQNAKWKA